MHSKLQDFCTVNSIKTRTADFLLDDNGILHISPFPDAQIDYEDALDNALVMKKLTGNKPCLKIVDSTTNWTMNKKAKIFSDSKELREKTIARAIVKGSLINTMILNFFVRLSRTDVPTKIFTDRDEAYEWLMSFKK
jgi:hypothetical protein